MIIFYDAFCVLPLAQQLPLVWKQGTFVARRWDAGQVVVLFLMDGGFLCEVFLTRGASSVQHVRHFVPTDSERLEPYLCYIQLGDLLGS